MSESGKAVFLSYASQDAEAARRICEALRAGGVEVWFDQHELRGGDIWDQKIRRQIKECEMFVPIISMNTQARAEGYFRLEWRLADQRTHLMGKSRTFLLPVCIDRTDEGGADVPESFTAAQWARLPGGDCSADLVERVRVLLGLQRPGSGRAIAAGSEPSVRGAKPPASKGIAVLAFANLSNDPENEYFSDGISEELLNVLAKVPGLRVTARTSSFHFKGRNMPIRQIAQELGVAYVVEGSVRKAGNRVRITAQLIDATEDAHLWSDTFDRELKDVFAVQDEIAALIAKNLQLRMSRAPRAAKTVDPEAYRLCLEGRRAAVMLSQDGFTRAEALFTRATQIDGGFAVARADLAQVGLFRAMLKVVAARHIATELEETERRAREALALDSTIGEPHMTLAEVAMTRGDVAEAETEIGLAMQLAPECEHLVAVYPFVFMQTGRPDRAVSLLEEARLRDPLSWLASDLHGLCLSQAGRDCDALPAFQRAQQLGGPPVVAANHSVALANLGRHEEAVEMARIAVDAGTRPGWGEGFVALSDGIAARVLAQSGHSEEAQAIVRRLLQGPAQRHFNAGAALALLGETERAVAVLRDFPQQLRGYLLHFLHVAEQLRDDPRCGELLRYLGATEAFNALGRVRHEFCAGKSADASLLLRRDSVRETVERVQAS